MTSIKKIIFAGTSDFAVPALKALFSSKYEVIGVFTQPDRPAGRGQRLHQSPIKEAAVLQRTPVYQPVSLKTSAEQDVLRALKPDLLIVAAYGLILPKAVLDIPKFGCINIHGSLLPRWRGAAPIQHALLAGDAVTGISIMQMDEGLDTGPVLARYPCPFSLTETSGTLQHKLSLLGADALMETLAKLGADAIVAEKQDPLNATHASKISKQDACIQWHESADSIERKIRAFNPRPVAHTIFEEKMIRLWQAKSNATHSDAKPGAIIGVDKESIEIATGSGTLKLLEIQLPAHKRLAVHDILNAKKDLFKVGARFH